MTNLRLRIIMLKVTHPDTLIVRVHVTMLKEAHATNFVNIANMQQCWKWYIQQNDVVYVHLIKWEVVFPTKWCVVRPFNNIGSGISDKND